MFQPLVSTMSQPFPLIVKPKKTFGDGSKPMNGLGESPSSNTSYDKMCTIWDGEFWPITISIFNGETDDFGAKSLLGKTSEAQLPSRRRLSAFCQTRPMDLRA